MVRKWSTFKVVERGHVAVEDRRAADQDRLVRPLDLDPMADVDSREQGQVEVEQDQVERAPAREQADALQAVGRFDDLEAFSAEELRDQASQEILVLHQ